MKRSERLVRFPLPAPGNQEKYTYAVNNKRFLNVALCHSPATFIEICILRIVLGSSVGPSSNKLDLEIFHDY